MGQVHDNLPPYAGLLMACELPADECLRQLREFPKLLPVDFPWFLFVGEFILGRSRLVKLILPVAFLLDADVRLPDATDERWVTTAECLTNRFDGGDWVDCGSDRHRAVRPWLEESRLTLG